MKIYTDSVTGRKYTLSGRCVRYQCTECGKTLKGYDAISESYVCSNCRIGKENKEYQEWVAQTGGYKNKEYNEALNSLSSWDGD